MTDLPLGRDNLAAVPEEEEGAGSSISVRYRSTTSSGGSGTV